MYRHIARWAKDKMGIRLDEHRPGYAYRRPYRQDRARQSLVELSAYCNFLHTSHMHMLWNVGIGTVCAQSN